MSQKKSKATKLIDSLVAIATRRARIGADEIEATEDEVEVVDEELFMAKSRLHYYINSLNTKVRALQDQIKRLESFGFSENTAMSAVRKTNEMLSDRQHA